MKKYKTKHLLTGQLKFFVSRREIAEFYAGIITESNLSHHFTVQKKQKVIIRGILVEKL